MIQRVHILGATGSGTTTLGAAVAEKIDYAHFDNDNYFFESKNNLFTVPRRPVMRDSMLDYDLRSTPAWVLSGAVCGWGDFIMRYFDLVVFLKVPLAQRMQRIKAREEKLGRKIDDPRHPRYRKYQNFIKWASAYETGGNDMRSLAQHEEWLQKLACPVLRIEGDSPLAENMQRVVDYIAELS
ncbi:MAG: hypothetical protein R3297_02645 [Desulfobulbales bacterium]|nr:hypothetical protein [Desulfobulbales bacterium]